MSNAAEKAPSTPAVPVENTGDELAVRAAKLATLRAAGADPFRAETHPTHTSKEALELGQGLSEAEPEVAPRVAVAGRLMVYRLMGKAAFGKILDRDGLLQLYFKKDVLGEAAWEAFRKLDVGDILGAEGPLFITKTGEVTVRVERFTLVAKALRPLPEKWHGMADPDQIYRQRYLDLIVNDESRKRFKARSLVLKTIRQVLDQRGFQETETPILQGTAGGAAARPFVTHHNALGQDFFLRIALELYLKRLLVGGLDRVYEIGRNFRNEGLSRKHNPEFTMLEAYQAYSDFRGMMELTRTLIQSCARAVNTQVYDKPEAEALRVKNSDGVEIDLGGEWRQARYRDLIVERTGDAAWFTKSKAEKIGAAEQLGLKPHNGWEDFEVTQEVYSKLIEPNLVQPTFVTHLPKELCPLAKFNAEDPSLIDVFELVINGQEIAPAYSEQNDPVEQRAQFTAQAGEDVQKVDEDFLTALEHGMPPAGGMGMGIDRLCILLTGAASIRDTILFPALRNKE